MPISRKRIFRVAAPAPATIYVRAGYNRVLAEEFEALKAKRVGLVKDKVEAHSQGDLRENFGFKAAKEDIRAVDRKMTALDRFVARKPSSRSIQRRGSPSPPRPCNLGM